MADMEDLEHEGEHVDETENKDEVRTHNYSVVSFFYLFVLFKIELG